MTRIVRPPRRFVGLHAHSGFSTYDGLSLPQAHIDFVLNNEMDAWALTDHGNANGHAHAFTKLGDLKNAGRAFKFIPGCEFYLHPDLVEWKREWIAAKERKAKLAKRPPADDVGGGGFEDEEESKQTKWYDPVKRRHHLVVLAKDRIGLENLYTLITRSYDEGFYRFPRIDYRMLAEHSEGLVVSTACIGGPMAYEVMRRHQDVEWDDMLPHVGTQETFELIQKDLAEVAGRLQECVGEKNFFLELQFNRLGVQHLVNRHLIELSHRTNIPLIATADSHYPGPGLWKDRELYKKLGWLNYDKYEPGMLPTSSDELKVQLYPKNAMQMWDAYWDSRDYFDARVKDWSFYDDQEVSDAIERSYDVAHDLCGEARPETRHLFAASIVPDDPKTGTKMDPFHALVGAVQEGMRRRGLHDKPEYIDRMRDELQVIKEKDFALYFLTMAKVMNIATDHMLVGPGRGSGAGSLVNYVLGITHVDPLRYGLLFARFLSRNRKEAPDIDSDVADNDTLKAHLREAFGEANVVPVSNYNTLALKSLVKDISRFYGIDFNEVNAATKGVENEVKRAILKPGDDKNVFVLRYDDAMEHSPKFRTFIEKYPQIGDHIKNLFEQNKSIGRHAGGVVIGEGIEKRMPVIRVRGEKQTSWTEGLHYRHLEGTAGLLKYDLLGLKTLRIIQRCIDLILRRKGLYSIELGDDELRLVGDVDVVTSNRGTIKVSELTEDDDLVEVPGVWREDG